jgi:hypothetical protein
MVSSLSLLLKGGTVWQQTSSHSSQLLDIHYKHQNDLIPWERAAIFDLLRKNMKSLYLKSVYGWKEGEKRKEMFSPNSMFLIIYGDGFIKGFVHFQVVDEDTLTDDDIKQRVIYWQVFMILMMSICD